MFNVLLCLAETLMYIPWHGWWSLCTSSFSYWEISGNPIRFKEKVFKVFYVLVQGLCDLEVKFESSKELAKQQRFRDTRYMIEVLLEGFDLVLVWHPLLNIPAWSWYGFFFSKEIYTMLVLILGTFKKLWYRSGPTTGYFKKAFIPLWSWYWVQDFALACGRYAYLILKLL